MIATAGLVTVVMVLVAIMSKRLSPLMALVAIPTLVALAVGKGAQLPTYLLDGITGIAPITVMFMFAILFFGIMNDAGTFDPILRKILGFCRRDPRKLFVGIALMTGLVHLDGSGASTFLIVVPAFLPLFKRLAIDPKLLTAVVAMSAGVNNMLPWGGPTIRAAAALDIPVMDLYGPLIPAHLSGFALVLALSWWLGSREHRRLHANGDLALPDDTPSHQENTPPPAQRVRWLLNLVLIATVITVIVSAVIHPALAFLFATLLALLINFPGIEQQRQRIDAHAKPALMMVTILFAAGCFTGILRGSGMLDAMAQGGSQLLPGALTEQLPLLVALVSMPLSLLFDPDSFYFGIMPVLAGIAGEAGLPPASVAHGALLGQMTTGFPVSPLTPATFLLVGLAGVNLAEHQRFAMPLLFALSLFMTLVCVLTGVLPI